MERTFVDDNEPVYIEIALPAADDAEGGLQDADLSHVVETIRGKVQEIPDATLFNGFKSIYKIARKAQILMADLSADDTTHQLEQGEIVFGLSFSAKGVPYLTVGVDAALSITLKWARKS